MSMQFITHMSRRKWNWLFAGVGTVAAAMLFSGCKGIPTKSEKQSRADLKAVTQVYRPGERKATLFSGGAAVSGMNFSCGSISASLIRARNGASIMRPSTCQAPVGIAVMRVVPDM